MKFVSLVQLSKRLFGSILFAWASTMASLPPAHAGLSAIVDRLACGTLLAPELSEIQQRDLEGWFATELGTALGPNPRIITQTARDSSWYMTKARINDARHRRLIYKSLADPAIQGIELIDFAEGDWTSSVSRANPILAKRDIVMMIVGRDFTWRPNSLEPTTGDFILSVVERSLYGRESLSHWDGDPLPALVERARSHSATVEIVQMVSSQERRAGYRSTYVRIDAGGTPAQRLQKTLNLMHALEDEILKAPSSAEMRGH